MDRTFLDPNRQLDGDSDFTGPGILEPAADLGWKAGLAGLAVGAFGAKFYWPKTVKAWPTIGRLTASYGELCPVLLRGYSSLTALEGAMGAAFGAVRGLSEDLRHTDSSLNWFKCVARSPALRLSSPSRSGGFAAGVVNGLRLRNIHAGVLSAVVRHLAL